MARLFLSYDREDADKAQAIAGALEKAGHDVWWDRHIRGGAEYSEEIEQALDDADAVIVLWSTKSVKSAWVRDEAAAGRDSGRLVPVLVEPIKPPMGFRQYQSVDLADWSPRRRSSQFDDLLKATRELSSAAPRHDRVPTAAPAPAPSVSKVPDRRTLALAAATLLLMLAFGAWLWLRPQSGPSTISVVASDSRPLSQALARSLLVKLGTLQASQTTGVQLLDDSVQPGRADLKISVSGTTEAGRPRATLTLASNKEAAMLWSRDFSQPTGKQADLEEQIAFSTARVLECAVEEASGKNGRLPVQLRRSYLNACASLAEIGWDKRSVLGTLRQVVESSPGFVPAWSKLIAAEADAISFLESGGEDVASLRAQLERDILAAQKIAPNLAEISLARLALDPGVTPARALALLDKAKASDPDNPRVLSERSGQLQRVGRMRESVNDAERAAQLDPLSPATRQTFILALAYAGDVGPARQELARAKQLWPGTQAMRDAEFALELRFGDFETLLRDAGSWGTTQQLYIAARKDPSPANASAFIKNVGADGIQGPELAFVAQALAEMNRPDDFYALIREPQIARLLGPSSYVLFRPYVAPIRKDARFMRLAKLLGLVDYWRSSGKWPDYCAEPALPYDCKTEAAKYGA